ncbi:MAG TPA: 7TM diverse intracellular signaling domain-containing protein [Cellvibrionaceae bacterium]|nr:7TM diverse intracellular signaling domain-containing protein [Cellvibrionaceae bacterium]HNG61311.1 7TM diverse intracellular signaling domain-containing protein [Cellvibrionaceae bacterium]
MRSVIQLLFLCAPTRRFVANRYRLASLGILAVILTLTGSPISRAAEIPTASASAQRINSTLAAHNINQNEEEDNAAAQVVASPFLNIPAVNLSRVKPTTPLEPYVFYLPDTNGGLDALQAMRALPNFMPLQKKPITFQTKSHWYALPLHNDLNMPVERFITTGVSTAPLLRAYWISQEIAANPQDIKPIASQLAYGFPTLLFNLPINSGESGVFLIEYQSIAHFPITLHLYDAAQLFEATQRLKMANGIYIGAIGILFLFFFGQFLISREKVYFYYSMFVLFAILIMMQISGPAQLFNQDSHHQTMLTTLIGGGIYTFYFIFTAEFLQFKQRNKFLYRALLILSASVLALTAISIVYPSAYALSVVIAIGLPFPIAGAIWAWRQKISSALFFLVGSLTHCISTYFLLFACLGFAPFRNELIFRIACLGMMFDIICFALAIIYHSHQVRIHYNRQLQERIDDLNALAESERLSAQALSMSKQAVLNLAATAHDLQQPLSAMQLLLSLQNSADPAIQNVQGALNYACSLLNSALGTARQDYQTFAEMVDSKSLLGAAQARHQARFSEKKITLKMRSPAHRLKCLPIVVNRILDNLLSNAHKYTHSGTVLIAGRKRKNGDFLIQIWDTGRGMDHKQTQRLTTPFERIQDTEELGFGLGLFIVKSLCHQAGYHFAIHSKEQRGSCVSILIPHSQSKQDWLEV